MSGNQNESTKRRRVIIDLDSSSESSDSESCSKIETLDTSLIDLDSSSDYSDFRDLPDKKQLRKSPVEWICEVCIFHNSPSKTSCEMCGTPSEYRMKQRSEKPSSVLEKPGIRKRKHRVFTNQSKLPVQRSKSKRVEKANDFCMFERLSSSAKGKGVQALNKQWIDKHSPKSFDVLRRGVHVKKLEDVNLDTNS